MIPDDFQPHDGERRRPTVTQNAYGNDEYAYPASGPATRGWAQQRSTTELVGGRETVVTQWWWFTNDPDWRPLDRLVWGGLLFHVDGEPKPVYAPDGLHHLEVPLRRVTG